MTIHVHRLEGCAPTPLAWYLKGLGVLRLVGEQADTSARGFWRDEAFWLATRLGQEELERFFLRDYSPTPLVAPWNSGSGFYPKDNTKALTIIAATDVPSFVAYRGALLEAKAIVGARPEAPKAEKKVELIAQCRSRWRGPLLDWFECALVLGAGSRPKAEYPALLGTGGNDGRMDFTNNFMQRLTTLLVSEHSGYFGDVRAGQLLEQSLWSSAVCGLPEAKVGQYLPGAAGGANSTTGPDGEGRVNPWDFVLMLEGAVLFAASVVRRTASESPTSAAAPFAIRAAASGYASASKIDEESRGEQWMPLWSAPATLSDVRRLLAEGRAQLGASPAGRPVDFARAVARLGVARGITAFQRFGYIERNGQSNLATPLGRWVVAEQPGQNLLDDLDSWLSHIQRSARDKDAPKSLVSAHRRLEEALLDVCGHGSEPSRWQSLLIALADLERRLVQSPGFTAKQRLQPIPPLRAGWVTAADDGTPALRLALALASQGGDAGGRDSVRAHWLPLGQGGRFATDAGGLRKDPRVVCQGLDPWRDCVSLVRRRLVEGGRGAESRLPLMAAASVAARLSDIGALLGGDVDLALVSDLACGLMALDRRSPLVTAAPPTTGAAEPSDLYALFRLACLPWPLPRGSGSVPIHAHPAIVARLAAGDLASAGDLAIRRLTACGLKPRIRRVAGNPDQAVRLAASLAFPISPRAADLLADRLIHTTEETAHVA